jgi:Fe-S cluster assembly protein SufB
MAALQETVDQVRRIDVDQYKYGFVTDIESDKAPKGLSEDTVRFISEKKGEPEWMLAWRLEAYKRWLTMREPKWARVEHPPIDYQDLYYYSAPKRKALASLDEVDPEILKTYEKLGIPLREQEILAGVERPVGDDGELENGAPRRVAVDAVFDSVSIATTFQEELKRAGVIFMPISQALKEHPDLVRKNLGTVVSGVLRRLLRLRAARRALPDGAVDLFPHQREEYRPVRTHPDHRRQGLLRLLSRRLHRTIARREPIARGCGGTGGA